MQCDRECFHPITVVDVLLMHLVERGNGEIQGAAIFPQNRHESFLLPVLEC